MEHELTLGEKIAYHRRRLSMSQRDLATEIGRSESWVSQVERGARTVDRLSVLQQVADALGISVSDLRSEVTEEPPERSSDVEALRLALTGHPALDAVIDSPAPLTRAELSRLRDRHERVWPLVHESRYDELEPLLTALIGDLEMAVRRASPDERSATFELLSSTYQAAAAMLARLGESDAAWVAADRSILVDENVTEPFAVIAGTFRMAHAFMGMRQLNAAHHVAERAAAVLKPRVDSPDASAEALSLYGAMHLVLAVVAARDGDRKAARAYLEEAQTIADRLGEDRDDFGTEFGPTNVAIHAVSVAADLGDAGEAIDLAKSVDVSRLSPERQFRLHLDVARAETQRRHLGEAVTALQKGREVAPEHFVAHPLPRETVRDLVQLAGRRITPELRDVARELGVLP